MPGEHRNGTETGTDRHAPRSEAATTRKRRLATAAGASLLALLAVAIWTLRTRPSDEPTTPPGEMEARGGPMTEGQMNTLQAGHTTEHRLPGGESDDYRLPLTEGDFVAVEVEQKGLDVVVRLFAPSGEMLMEVDSPNGAYEVERVSAIAEPGGDYRVEVEAFADGEQDGTYAIGIETLRPATDDDRTRVAAEQALARGDGLRREKRPADALPEYERALDGWRSLGDRGGEAVALYRIGWAHQLLEHYQEAVEPYRQALELYRELGDRPLEATISNRLGWVLLLLGRLTEAGESNRRALELFVELDDRDGEAAAANRLGNVHKWSGRTEEALTAYERALELWEEAGSRHRVTARLNIGDVYLANDDAELALPSFERALAGAREAGDRGAEATCQLKAGEALARLGRFEEARGRLEEALAIHRELESLRDQAVVLSALGTLRLKTGNLPGAKEDLEEALRLFTEVDDPVGRALAHHKLGRCHHAAGDPEAARREHEAALPLFLEAGDRQGAASTRYGIARALYATGDYDGARRVLEQVLESAESLRAESASLELRSSYLASRRHYWDLYVRSLMRLDEEEPDSGFDWLALQVTERWRSRGLLDLLAEAGVQIREGAPAELLERERSITTELDAVARRHLQLMGEGTRAAALSHLSDRETELLLELDRTRARIRSESARLEHLSDPDPLDLSATTGRLLDSDTLLLVYFLGEDASFLWTVSRQGVGSHRLPPRSEIEEVASAYYDLLPRRSSRAALHRAELGQRLGQMLLGPIARDLDEKRLAVVADGALHYLPFTALPVPEGAPGPAGELLVDRHEIVHLPSASVLASLRYAQTGRPRAPKTVAVIADPVFDRDDPRLAGREGADAEPSAPHAADAALGRVLRDSGSGGLERLLHSAEEARAILELVPEGSRFSALGFDASYPLLEGDHLADYRILHLATHGLIDRDHPELSGLALSLFDRDGAPQRGFLRLHEIYNLRLGAELVVLSACETGLGEELEGEGLVGLTRGFLYAGAPQVVHSLWKVGDASAAELMKRFYVQLLQKELPPPAALRAAQLSMRHEDEWSDPFHWAAFVFQGDWRGTGHPLGDDPIEEADKGAGSPGDGVKPDEDLPPPSAGEPPPKGYVPPQRPREGTRRGGDS